MRHANGVLWLPASSDQRRRPPETARSRTFPEPRTSRFPGRRPERERVVGDPGHRTRPGQAHARHGPVVELAGASGRGVGDRGDERAVDLGRAVGLARRDRADGVGDEVPGDRPDAPVDVDVRPAPTAASGGPCDAGRRSSSRCRDRRTRASSARSARPYRTHLGAMAAVARARRPPGSSPWWQRRRRGSAGRRARTGGACWWNAPRARRLLSGPGEHVLGTRRTGGRTFVQIPVERGAPATRSCRRIWSGGT